MKSMPDRISWPSVPPLCLASSQPRNVQTSVSAFEFPESIRVGSSNNATVILRNPGEVKLTGMNVELAWDPTLRVRFVDSNNNARFRLSADGRSAVWDGQDLLPPVLRNSGESIRTLTLSFESMAPVTQGSITAKSPPPKVCKPMTPSAAAQWPAK